MGLSKCAAFSETVVTGWEIPVKNTFINFDLPSQPPAARVRSRTCPCTGLRRFWEDATQELCHAMAPTRQRDPTMPGTPHGGSEVITVAEAPRHGEAEQGPRSDTPTELVQQTAAATTELQPEGATPTRGQQDHPRTRDADAPDADAISEVSTTSSERVDEKPCQDVPSKWKSVQPRKKGKPPQRQQQQQQQAQPQQQQPQQPQHAASGSLPSTPVAKAPSSRGQLPAGGRHEQVRRQDTSSSCRSDAAPAHAVAGPHCEGGAGGKGEGKGKGGGLLHFRKIEVGIEDDPHFRVVQRLIGPKGKHMQDILNQARGAKIWIIGRGSRSWEDDVGPLVVCVGAREPTSFETAVSLVRELLSRVREDHSKFRR